MLFRPQPKSRKRQHQTEREVVQSKWGLIKGWKRVVASIGAHGKWSSGVDSPRFQKAEIPILSRTVAQSVIQSNWAVYSFHTGFPVFLVAQLHFEGEGDLLMKFYNRAIGIL